MFRKQTTINIVRMIAGRIWFTKKQRLQRKAVECVYRCGIEFYLWHLRLRPGWGGKRILVDQGVVSYFRPCQSTSAATISALWNVYQIHYKASLFVEMSVSLLRKYKKKIFCIILLYQSISLHIRTLSAPLQLSVLCLLFDFSSHKILDECIM